MPQPTWKITTFVLAGAMTLMLGVSVLQAQAAQPHMKTALELLVKAEAQLTNATADKGGHRANALKHLKAAIAEVKEGIKFDNQH